MDNNIINNSTHSLNKQVFYHNPEIDILNTKVNIHTEVHHYKLLSSVVFHGIIIIKSYTFGF